MKTIPQLIDYVTPSEEAICLHEAGHAFAALIVGLPPAMIELVNDPGAPGLARNRIPVGNQQQRRVIACAAFAVEYRLFRDKRLVDSVGAPVEEGPFMQIALGSNASADKVTFFGENRAGADGRWPRADDEMFMNDGIGLSANLVMPLVIEVAELLLNERRLDYHRIVEVGAKHLPGMAAKSETLPRQ